MNIRSIVWGAAVGAAMVSFASELEQGFVNPPTEARARTWWHWMDRNITKEGITKDLEAMKRAGLGGATILDIACFGDKYLKGPVKTLSPEWFDCVNHAVLEAKRLGLDLSVANCPGWSSSGGPWIRAPYSMKNIGYTETTVEGGKHVSLKLETPHSPKGFLKEVAVLAFPSISGDGYSFKDDVVKTTIHHDEKMKLPPEPQYVKYTFDPKALWDGLWYTEVLFNPSLAKSPEAIDFELKEPRAMRGVRVDLSGPPWRNSARYNICVSEDGKTWKRHCTTSVIVNGGGVATFPEVKSRFFRIEPRDTKWLPIIGVHFTPAIRIPQIALKCFNKHDTFTANPTFWKEVIDCPKSAAVDPDKIIDISAKMDASGKLEWDAPAGKWTIMRFSMITIGGGNHPANPEGRGLECDKMSKAGVDEAWRGMMKPIIDRANASGAPGVVKYTLIDSYEVGPQNWTDLMPQEFRELRGYDLKRYLPIFSGRFVRDSATSERFLEDFRRTVSDLYAKYYGNYFREKTNADGVQFELEPYGGPFDELLQGRAADVVMGEFWRGAAPAIGNSKVVSNVGDINGKPYVQTETFTAGRRAAAWTSSPASHKLQGDYAFCAGVNRFVFHSYAHQAYETTGPGITMGIWGFHFNRHNTLWNYYRGWLDYVGRAQYLLQQGKTVTDVLYVTKEDTPVSPTFTPKTPYGFNSNAIDARTFMDGVRSVDGYAEIPGGRRYSVVVMPQHEVVSPALLKKIDELVAAGVAVVRGPKLVRSFGLKDREVRDGEVSAFASRTWPKLKATVEEAIAARGLRPDFSATGDKNFMKLQATWEALRWIHRRTDDLDIYFVANIQRGNDPLRFSAAFRATGAVELWDAESGKMRPAPIWRRKGEGTEVAMELPHGTSVFVVFRRGVRPSAESCGVWPGEEAPPPPRIRIVKAVFRATDKSKEKDVTEVVRKTLVGGESFELKAYSNALGGDAAPGKEKELYCEYELDGEMKTAIVKEWKVQSIKAPLRKKAQKMKGEVESLDCSSGWQVCFQPNRGAPAKPVVFDSLKSLSENAEPGIRYFSGTAVYTKKVTMPASGADKSKFSTKLDLGEVGDLCRVRVNGRDLGILWHFPFLVDITDVIKSGENTIEVEVANRWINRIIGDEQEDEVGKWSDGGANDKLLTEFPDGFVQGKLPPKHYAFTTYRPYHKNDKLMPSGLIGPARLIVIAK